MSQTSAKRGPYASKACVECQRRKTKCTEERPCASCVSREVPCTSCDPEPDQPRPMKRPRLQPKPSQAPVQLAPSTPAPIPLAPHPVPVTIASLPNESLAAELRQLRRDLDMLSKMSQSSRDTDSDQGGGTEKSRDSQQPAQRGPPTADRPPIPLVETTARAQSATAGQDPPPFGEQVSPLEIPAVSPLEHVAITPGSSHTDTFNPASAWASPGAIANKIGAIRNSMLSDGFLREPLSGPGSQTFTLTLPRPARLRHQVDLFLFEFDDFFPFFRKACLQQRISAALHSLSFSERRTTINVPYQYGTTFAILCNILGFAETASASVSTMDPNTGQEWFRRGARLMEHFEDIVGDSVGVVTYHVLAASSLMEGEKLRQATVHIVRALHTARSIGLDDKERWQQDPDDIVVPQCLLMGLYFVEKRIHYKCGISPLLRPDDISLDDFIPLRGTPGIEDTKLEYIEAMVSYSKLWTSIWSGFLAAKAERAGNWSEIQIADATILIKYRELPERLHWETENASEYLLSGVSLAYIRQKLQAFLWHQSLRLIIRQTRISDPDADLERQRSCFQICKIIVAAIATYVERFVCMRPLGYFLTCSLVDCIFHMKQEQRAPSTFAEQVELQVLFKEIKQVLETLAMSVGCAQRALEALRCVLVMSSDWDFGLDLTEFAGGSALLPSETYNLFSEKDRASVPGYTDGSLAGTMDFLGLLPA